MKKTVDYFFKVICLFPIYTVYINGGIGNKILFSLTAFLLIRYIIGTGISKWFFMNTVLVLAIYLFSLSQTEFPIANSNMLFYYPFFFEYSLLMISRKRVFEEWVVNHKRYVDTVLIVWTCIVGISIFIPSCYYTKEAGALYFGSFARTIFRLGPAAVFIQALSLVGMSYYKNKKYILYMIVPLYCYFMGSSRAYLVVGIALFTIAWYWYGAKKSVFYLTLIPMIAVGGLLILKSSMGSKIAYTLNDNLYGDFWFRITSSRSLLWERDLNAYNAQNAINRLFGAGIEFCTKVSGLWAHNDFIEILCSYGLVGVFHYLYTSIKVVGLSNPTRNKRQPILMKMMLYIAWLFNAFFNMHFTYFCCVLAFPLICITVGNKYKGINQNG